jgi:flagellar biogenesis protein FliO
MSTELKEQLKQELLDQKEKEVDKIKKENSKLKEIIVYTKKDHPQIKQYTNYMDMYGIKYIEKDLGENLNIMDTVQMNSVCIIFVNEMYLVLGRDFTNPKQLNGILKRFADPEYVAPSIEVRTLEAIKNLSNNIQRSLQNINSQIQTHIAPISQVMSELVKEEKKEQGKNPKIGPKQKDA